MDSLTQIVLGAAAGEAALGKKAGNKAMLWGAIAGTIPDLDVIFKYTHGFVSSIDLHRGFSHSFVFSFLFAPVLGWIISRAHRKMEIGWRDWTKLAFWGLVTHPLLDNFTTWGVEFFWPFSEYRIAFNTVFVIDPLYTVPFLILMIWMMFVKRGTKRRARLLQWGIGLSTFYLLLAVGFKFMTISRFEKAFAENNIEVNRFITRPTPVNTIVWMAIAESDSGYFIGYSALTDHSRYKIPFRFYPHHKHKIAHLKDDPDLATLIRLSKGYYMVEEVNEKEWIFKDLRFGQNNVVLDDNARFLFSYRLKEENGKAVVSRIRPTVENFSTVIAALWQRIKGRKSDVP